MDEPRLIQLLEEIRDLQRQHIELQKNAMEDYQNTVERQKKLQLIPLVFVGVLVLLLVYFLAVYFFRSSCGGY